MFPGIPIAEAFYAGGTACSVSIRSTAGAPPAAATTLAVRTGAMLTHVGDKAVDDRPVPGLVESVPRVVEENRQEIGRRESPAVHRVYSRAAQAVSGGRPHSRRADLRRHGHGLLAALEVGQGGLHERPAQQGLKDSSVHGRRGVRDAQFDRREPG